MTLVYVIILFFGLSGLGSGCATSGATVARPRPTSAMTARDMSLFDDGVDFVADPSGLQGSWFRGWEHDLEQRMARADVVALVGIASLGRSDVEGEGEDKFVLSPQTQRVLKGSWPDGAPLVSGEDSPGFVTLEHGHGRVLQGSYVLFAKWASRGDGTVEPRWHLSRAEGAVLENVSRRFGDGDDSRTVVIRRSN